MQYNQLAIVGGHKFNKFTLIRFFCSTDG